MGVSLETMIHTGGGYHMLLIGIIFIQLASISALLFVLLVCLLLLDMLIVMLSPCTMHTHLSMAQLVA